MYAFHEHVFTIPLCETRSQKIGFVFVHTHNNNNNTYRRRYFVHRLYKLNMIGGLKMPKLFDFVSAQAYKRKHSYTLIHTHITDIHKFQQQHTQKKNTSTKKQH